VWSHSKKIGRDSQRASKKTILFHFSPKKAKKGTFNGINVSKPHPNRLFLGIIKNLLKFK
jgi:hypothetical protein